MHTGSRSRLAIHSFIHGVGGGYPVKYLASSWVLVKYYWKSKLRLATHHQDQAWSEYYSRTKLFLLNAQITCLLRKSCRAVVLLLWTRRRHLPGWFLCQYGWLGWVFKKVDGRGDGWGEILSSDGSIDNGWQGWHCVCSVSCHLLTQVVDHRKPAKHPSHRLVKWCNNKILDIQLEASKSGEQWSPCLGGR